MIVNKKSINFIQFTNPTAYPPLEHSGLILSRQGWEVIFTGIQWNNSGDFSFSEELNPQIFKISAAKSGWKRKVLLASFTMYSVLVCLKKRPHWIYVSDPMASPAGLLASILGFNVAYHEHDTPDSKPTKIKDKLIRSCRNLLARKCRFAIIPQETRKNIFLKETRTTKQVFRVWNCPRAEEVKQGSHPTRLKEEPLGIYYHGSITETRVPLSLIHAAGRSECPIILRVVGYETIGSVGITDALKESASLYSKTLDLQTPGPQPRERLFKLMDSMHIGWVAYNESDSDVNLRHLAGASNKAFDYLAAGLAIFMNNTDEWKSIFSQSDVSISCDTTNIKDLSSKIKWAYNNPERVSEMGRNGKQLISTTLNYQQQFKPVSDLLSPKEIR